MDYSFAQNTNIWPSKNNEPYSNSRFNQMTDNTSNFGMAMVWYPYLSPHTTVPVNSFKY